MVHRWGALINSSRSLGYLTTRGYIPPMKLADAIRKGRTAMQHSVYAPPIVGTKGHCGVILRVLKWAGENKKIGGKMEKGPWVGMPIFALTLEERRTCPKTCQRWTSCYGDNMMFARRYKHGRELERALTADLKTLSAKFPNGYVVRLHVLGDFYNVGYVTFWRDMLKRHSGLRIYGYTHWQHATDIGLAITRLVTGNVGRVSILRSDKAMDRMDPLPAAHVIEADATEPHPATAVICPQETGRIDTCGACGLCMLGRVSVSFLNHSHAVTVNKSLKARGLPVLNQ